MASPVVTPPPGYKVDPVPPAGYVLDARPTYENGARKGQPVPGLTRAGNVDVNHRPSIANADGSHSSIYSMTIPIGKDGASREWGDKDITGYALVPSIAKGKFLTPDGKMPVGEDAHQKLEQAATAYYNKTREHLGVFESSGYADEYAGLTHDYMNNGGPEHVYTPSPSLRAIAEQTQRNVDAPPTQDEAEPLDLNR